jgi:hypothetical protein
MRGINGLIMGCLLALIPTSNLHAMPWPRLLATKQIVDRVWRGDGHGCIQYSCGYWYGGIHITVGYDQQYRAVEFDTEHYSRPGNTKYWRLLTSFVPVGARRTACKSFKRTGAEDENMGPARGCVYRYRGKQILVVQWLAANPLDKPPALGIVMWNMGFIYLIHPDAP